MGESMLISSGYPGSKAGAGVWQRIISLMPVHHDYFELFLGHGAIIRRKKPAPGVNVGCDVDAGVVANWRQRPLPAHLTILQEDALRSLSSQKAMRDPTTLVYLDPPYLRSTRTRRIYPCEFQTPEQHTAMIKLANRCHAMVMISGYDSALYRKLLASWRSVSYMTMTRGGPRREFLWMNFDAGLPLHDPRFVGEGFRERERIKRKKQRWVARFSGMPATERQLINQALQEVMLTYR